ncbi:MAG: RHS repeat-associated core domain-containing protein [Phycisphaerae bacterium]
MVERYDYSAYGEPALLGARGQRRPGRKRAALTVSSVGNPLMHQGLYRDGESGSYQNRYRQYGSGVGRWMQVDPLGYWESLNPREYLRSIALRGTDGLGLGDDYEKEIIIQQAHRDRALILIAGAGDAAGEVAHGIDRAAVASVVIMLPGPDDAIIAVALGTKIGARVAGLIADTLKDAKVVRTGSRGRSTIVEIKDIAQRDKDWDRLTKGAKVDDKGGGVKVATHPDGTKIIKRPSTKDGRDTIEIQAPDGTTTKVRYGDKPDCPDAKKDGNARANRTRRNPATVRTRSR